MGFDPQLDYPQLMKADALAAQKAKSILESIAADKIVLGDTSKTTYSKDALVAAFMKGFYGTKAFAKSNADFVGFSSGDKGKLEKLAKDALAKPKGYDAKGWLAWSGIHYGSFVVEYGGKLHPFVDIAHWYAPKAAKVSKAPAKVSSSDESHMDFQEVKWKDHDGWNRSAAGCDYVVGWDPKEFKSNMWNAVHVGTTFDIGTFRFIIWLTPTEGFLECVNTKALVSAPKDVVDLMNEAISAAPSVKLKAGIKGYLKTSTKQQHGWGQWHVEPFPTPVLTGPRPKVVGTKIEL